MMTPEVIRQYVVDRASIMLNNNTNKQHPENLDGFKLRAVVIGAHRLLDADGVLYEYEVRLMATASTMDIAFIGMHNIIDLFSRNHKEGVPYLMKVTNNYYPRLEPFADYFDQDFKECGWFTNLIILSK